MIKQQILINSGSPTLIALQYTGRAFYPLESFFSHLNFPKSSGQQQQTKWGPAELEELSKQFDFIFFH